MYYWFEEQGDERYCFVKEPSKLANWRWEEVEGEEEDDDDGLDEDFINWFED